MGKIAGVAAGYAIGGVPGAVFGALAGHFVLDRINDRQVIFTIALISLAAKMTRADGIVSPIEVRPCKAYCAYPNRARQYGARIPAGAGRCCRFRHYARQIRDIYADSPQVLEDVLDVLFYIAYADGNLHPAEEEFLHIVAEIFEIDESGIRRVQARHDGSVQDPYVVLGVHRQAVMRLRAPPGWSLRANHPDQLQARGLPPEMMHIATARMAAINDAWETIRKERGL